LLSKTEKMGENKKYFGPQLLENTAIAGSRDAVQATFGVFCADNKDVPIVGEILMLVDEKGGPNGYN
jgi:hypothetical protein